MQGNKKIALNTGINYVRLLAVMGLTLFSTRYILLALGEVDFGLYNLIAGVVLLFSFIANTMATTTQRFISYSMGHDRELEKINAVFYNSLLLHVLIAIVVAVIIQAGGQLVIKYLLSIPPGKVADAYFVLITVTVGIVGTILIVPFEAVLMAHENILFISVCQLCNAVVKFGIALSLIYVDGDKLRFYALLIAVIPYIQLAFEWICCHRNYPETHFRLKRISDFSIFKNIGSFAGWVMIGTTCGTIRQQGTSILLNMFYGVIINAANGIAMQVNGILMQFSSSVTTAIRPQLIQSAGSGDKERMLTLTYVACKFPFLLTGLFAVPLMVAMPTVLALWLKEVPEYTVVFCRLLLFSALFNQSTMGMTAALEAYGKVRLVHTFVGISFLLVIPAGYALLACGFPPQCVMWCIVVNEAIAAMMRLLFAHKQLQINLHAFLLQIMARCLLLLLLFYALLTGIWRLLPANFAGMLLFGMLAVMLFAILTYALGLNQGERQKINTVLRARLSQRFGHQSL